jgi:hypothetical protein
MFKFSPPYLIYDNPADKVKIDKILRDFHIKNAKSATSSTIASSTGGILASASTPSGSAGGFTGTATAAAKATGIRKIVNARDALADADPSIGSSSAKPSLRASRAKVTDENKAGKLANAAAVGIVLTPSGSVKLGQNCKITFTAEAAAGTKYWYMCVILPGNIIKPYLLLGTLTTTSSATTVQFELDYNSYCGLAGKGFLIRATDPGGNTLQSDPASLDPTGVPSCNVINSVRFFTLGGTELGTTCDLKGGSHGDEPRFRVTLEVPAHQGGQMIRIKSSNKNKVWIAGDGNTKLEMKDFLIPEGQQYFEDYGFIKTANVNSLQTHQLYAYIVHPNGSLGDTAYAEISLLK